MNLNNLNRIRRTDIPTDKYYVCDGCEKVIHERDVSSFNNDDMVYCEGCYQDILEQNEYMADMMREDFDEAI